MSDGIGENSRELFHALVARTNHLFWARLLIPSSSDCSEAATEPHGYSAPIPMPSKKLSSMVLGWTACKGIDSALTGKH